MGKMAMAAKMGMKMAMAMKMGMKRNKSGKIVSAKASNRAKNSKSGKKIAAWGAATKTARKALGIKGFCPVGGSSAKGKALLAKVRSIYKKYVVGLPSSGQKESKAGGRSCHQ